MKIFNDVLSEDLYTDCVLELQNNVNSQVWSSSTLNWVDEVKRGIRGSCLTTKTSDFISKRLEKELKNYFPKYNYISFQYNVWQYHSGLPIHNDTNHLFGATIYLNNEWDLNYGGIFIWKNIDSNIHNAICPKRNMMILNDDNTEHMVTPITMDIPDLRCTIQIWGENGS